MTATTLFGIALVVFGLMVTGLYLSIREFLKASEEPSTLKEAIPANLVRRDFRQDRQYGA